MAQGRGEGYANREWRKFSREAAYVGTYRDYQGYRGAFFVEPGSLRTFGPINLDVLASHKGGVPAAKPQQDRIQARLGDLGTLNFYGIVQKSGPGAEDPAQGTLISFGSGPRKISLKELLSTFKDPLVLGLLAGDPELGAESFAQLNRFTKNTEKSRAMQGLLLSGARERVYEYIQSHLHEDLGIQFPDYRVLAPLVLDGLPGLSKVKESHTDRNNRSSLYYFIPALPSWFEGDKDQFKTVLFDAIVGQNFTFPHFNEDEHPPVETTPNPQPGPFVGSDGYLLAYWDTARLFRAQDKEFYHHLRKLFRELSAVQQVYFVGEKREGNRAYAVYVQGEGDWAGLGKVSYQNSLPKTLEFGSQFDVLSRDGGTYDDHGILDRGLVEAYQIKSTNPKEAIGKLELIRGAQLNQAVLFLARAAEKRQSGYGWNQLKSHVKHNLPELSEDLLQGAWKLALADLLRDLLKEYARHHNYWETGEMGFQIIVTYLMHGENEKATRALADLEPTIQRCKETFDGRGDIGEKNRILIDAFEHLLAKRLHREAKLRFLTSEQIQARGHSQLKDYIQNVPAEFKNKWLEEFSS